MKASKYVLILGVFSKLVLFHPASRACEKNNAVFSTDLREICDY